MRGKRADTPDLNIRRLEIISKGFLNKKEIREFVPCGQKRANEIYDEIRKSVKKEGFENLSDVILSKRMLKFLDLSIADIRANAKYEQQMKEKSQA